MLECHVKKPNLIFSLTGAGMFILLGLLIMAGTFGEGEPLTGIDRLFEIGLGLACVLFFGWIALLGLKQYALSRQGAVVRIDESGFLDRRISPEAIPWQVIRGARIFRGKTFHSVHSRFLSLDVADPEAYIKKGIGRFFPRPNRLLKRLYDEPGITISITLLDQSAETIMAAIEKESKGRVPIDMPG